MGATATTATTEMITTKIDDINHLKIIIETETGTDSAKNGTEFKRNKIKLKMRDDDLTTRD
jgi:hypothetical protein